MRGERTEKLTGVGFETDNIMMVSEVTEYLRIHRTTLYRLLKQKEIPAFRIGPTGDLAGSKSIAGDSLDSAEGVPPVVRSAEASPFPTTGDGRTQIADNILTIGAPLVTCSKLTKKVAHPQLSLTRFK
jgi:excisionase family DNA binding protein